MNECEPVWSLSVRTRLIKSLRGRCWSGRRDRRLLVEQLSVSAAGRAGPKHDLKAKPALSAVRRGRSSSLDRSARCVSTLRRAGQSGASYVACVRRPSDGWRKAVAPCRPGEPKVLQPASYLEYGTRLLRGGCNNRQQRHQRLERREPARCHGS